jgi:hypothetical protein
MASIVVSGNVLSRPGGASLAVHLQYLIGLRKLGHRVMYLEERGLADSSDPAREPGSGVPRAGLVLLRDLLRRCRVDVKIVWVDADAGLVGGMVWQQLRRRLSRADLLIDLGGHCFLEERALPARRALVELDDDPVLRAPGRQQDHDLYFSYRRNLAGREEVDWLPTVPPVVPRLWYGPPSHLGMPLQVLAGSDGGSATARFSELVAIGQRVGAPMWITVPAGDAELGSQLRAAGAAVCDAREVDASLSTFRASVIGSHAALSFLEADTGDYGSWLSSRSACFLAAGRPVVVASSGAGPWLPAGDGVMSVGGTDEAAAAIERIRSDLPRYSSAARGAAEQAFHYRVVLPWLLERALPQALPAVA